MYGQYRAQVFPTCEEQASILRDRAASNSIPVAEPSSVEATFWSAEAYHQKYRLRRNQELAEVLAATLGTRWDEHTFATKLNAVGQRGFDVKPWLGEMPEAIRHAFRRSMIAA